MLDRGLVGAVQPGRRAAGQHHRAEPGRSGHARSLAPCRTHATSHGLAAAGACMLSVTLVQEASGLDPAGTARGCTTWSPPTADLVVLPEAFARDFGEAGSDVSPYAEPLDGAFATELAAVAAERNTTVVAGMFETGEDPARPYNTLLVRGAADGVVPQDPPLRLLRLPGVRPAHRRARSSRWSSRSAGFGVGLMTCYDLRFPELARLLVDHGAEVLVVPAAWVAGPRKVDHWRTLVRARAIENTVFVVAAGQPGPALHRPLDGRGPARRRARRGRRRAGGAARHARPRRRSRRPGGPTPRSPNRRSVTCPVVSTDRPSTSRGDERCRTAVGRTARRRAMAPASSRARSHVAELAGCRLAGPAAVVVGAGRGRAGRAGRGDGPASARLAGRRRRCGRRDGVLVGAGGTHRRPAGGLRRPGAGAGRRGAAARPGLPAHRRRRDDLRGVRRAGGDGDGAGGAVRCARPASAWSPC